MVSATVALVTGLVVGLPDAAPAVLPDDWDAALEALAAADLAESVEDLAELAGPVSRPRNTLRWGCGWRQVDGATGRLAADLLAGPAYARLRLRTGTDRVREITGVLRAGTASWSAAAGWWSWQSGFGLLAGAAGRRPGLTADAGILPPRAGPRDWTGAPESRSLRGGAAEWRRGPWRLGAALGWATSAPANDRTLVAACGRADNRWTVTTVVVGGDLVALGGSGRWATGTWRGAWEVAWRPGSPAAEPPAGGVAMEWRLGRRASLGGICVAAPVASDSPLASGHELTGSRGGDGWAARGAWHATPRIRFLALVSARRRRTAGPGREQRRLFEIQARYRPGNGLDARVRFRGTTTAITAWETDWPWEPPAVALVGQRQTLGVTVIRETGGAVIRLDLRTLATRGTATSGRRSLLDLTYRGRATRGPAIRAGWCEAWGDPVDLVTAVSALPGHLAPRHWGAWRGELWCGLAQEGRLGVVAAAVHLRRPRLRERDVLEMRAELRLRW